MSFIRAYARLLSEMPFSHKVGNVSGWQMSHKFSNDRLWNKVVEKLSRYMDHDFIVYVGKIDELPYDVDDVSELINELDPSDRQEARRMVDDYTGNMKIVRYLVSLYPILKRKSVDLKRQHKEYRANSFEYLLQKYLGLSSADVKNSIVIFKTYENQAQMSPWMMVHQIGEALTQVTVEFSGAKFGKHFGTKGEFSDIIESYREAIDPDGRFGGDLADFVAPILQFGSARLRRANRDQQFDLQAEIITEYLWHNKRIRFGVPVGMDSDLVGRMISELEDLVARHLDACVGQIFIMSN